MPNTPKTTSTTTMVRKGKGKGKQVSTVSVLGTVQDEGEYPVEVEGEQFENSDLDATKLRNSGYYNRTRRRSQLRDRT